MSALEGGGDEASVSALGAICFQLAGRLRGAATVSADGLDGAGARAVLDLVEPVSLRLEQLGEAAQQLATQLAEANRAARRGQHARAQDIAGRAHARFVRAARALHGAAPGAGWAPARRLPYGDAHPDL